MTDKFTPGPWFYDEQTESVGSPAGWVANVPSERSRKSDVTFGDVRADGQLIAAAPDLLRACRLACEWAAGFPLGGEMDVRAAMEVYEATKRAIVKVEGGQE